MKKIFEDKNVSWKARGLYMYLTECPDVTIKELKEMSKDGQSSVSSGLKELEEKGYITRKRKRDSNGHTEKITTVFNK